MVVSLVGNKLSTEHKLNAQYIIVELKGGKDYETEIFKKNHNGAFCSSYNSSGFCNNCFSPLDILSAKSAKKSH